MNGSLSVATPAAERRRRHVVWSITWLAYATYYLGRKGFSAAKSSLVAAGLLSERGLGAIDTAYLAAYTVGQFVNGWLGDRVGARRLLGFGLLLSAACCAAFGSLTTAGALAAAFTLSGLAQASGWPGATRAMAEWTTAENRGPVMGLWSTCYQFGGLVAGPFAGILIARFGVRAAFHVPAAIMAVVAVLALAFVFEGPNQTRARSAAVSDAERKESARWLADERRAAQRRVVRSLELWRYGTSYFFIKFTRYALALWLPYYLSTQLGYGVQKAAFVATAFEAGGLVGVVGIGRLATSPRLRVTYSAVSLLGLAAALFVYARADHPGPGLNVALFALIGALLFAPDSLLSGAAAQDAGGPHAAAMATGFVNGVGSVGALLEGLTVPWLARRFGWSALFPCLVGCALLAAACLLVSGRGSRRGRNASFVSAG